ncbi:hypothetical protein CUR21_16835 [Pseudorhodobacter sp. MZDSW-24AT]|nr:hypothetical protein CUR21_16835 [Pseudorhodobacter sp. MZDSW-24AT]
MATILAQMKLAGSAGWLVKSRAAEVRKTNGEKSSHMEKWLRLSQRPMDPLVKFTINFMSVQFHMEHTQTNSETPWVQR